MREYSSVIIRAIIMVCVFIGSSVFIMAGRHADVYKKLKSKCPQDVNGRMHCSSLLVRLLGTGAAGEPTGLPSNDRWIHMEQW